MNWKFATVGLATIVCAGCNAGGGGTSTVELSSAGQRVVELKAGDPQLGRCQRLAEVKAGPPFVLPDDGRHKLRNEAGRLGANVMVVTNYVIPPATADAFRCS